MRILIVDELCYPQLGGQQVRFKELAEKWVSFGHDVTITAIDHLGGSPKVENINGVVYNRIISDANYYKSGPFGRKLSTIVLYSLKLRPYFLQKWDLIIFNQFPMLPELFYKFFFKKRAKTALDFVEHRDSNLWRKINRAIINSVDEVICISNHVKNCASLYRKHNLNIIPSLVDTLTCVSKSKKNYVFLGRLEKHKHPEHAIETVIEYNKNYSPKVEFQIVGEGALLESLKAEFTGSPNIKFMGSLDDFEKRTVLENGRVLILPSEREGLPKVVIEAMAYGIPTLTTNYPGNGTQFFVTEEMIGEVGLPTISDLVEKLRKIELNYDYYMKRCNNIKGNYDLTLNSNKYLQIFN